MKLITAKHKAKINTETYVTLCGYDLTMRDLLDWKCPNFIAARRLEKNFKKLHIDSLSKLYRTDPGSLYATKGIGVSQIFVAECLIHHLANLNPTVWWYKFEPKDHKKRGHEV